QLALSLLATTHPSPTASPLLLHAALPISLGVDLTPKLKLKAVAQASDAKAADELNKLVGHALNGLTIRADRELNPFIQFFPTLKDRKSTRLNSSHGSTSYAVSWLRKKHYY